MQDLTQINARLADQKAIFKLCRGVMHDEALISENSHGAHSFSHQST